MKSKRKTKQLRWLVTRLMLAMTMVMPASTWAQVMYTVYDTEAETLTFKYGNKPEGTATEEVYDVPTEPNTKPDWWRSRYSIKKVVFDGSFKDALPTSCYRWFEGYGNLTSIDNIENLNTANLTDMSNMFSDCYSLTSLDLSNFNTVNVTDMSCMFDGCAGLTSLKLSKFNTAKVTDMSEMFYNCHSLTSLDLSNFNTANVTDMSKMFDCCSSLTSLDLSKFNTANVTNMSKMFDCCSSLTSLDLSKFNTANVTNMMAMFSNCSGLTSLDLSSFNTANVTCMDWMFTKCSGLTTIYVSDDFTTGNVSYSYDMFWYCKSLKGAVQYSKSNTDKDMANFDGYFTPKIITPYVKWDKVTKVLIFTVANTKKEGSGVYDLNEGATAPGWSISEVKNNCTNVVFTPSFNHAKPTSCYKWFSDFGQLTTIKGIENLNTEEVTDMSEMFNSCSGLTSLDLSKFNTAKVTNMNGMFRGSGLISLDLSSFNTAKVTNMDGMFGGSGLTTIYVSDDFTTGEISSSGMFEGCKQLVGATSYDSDKTGIDMANYTSGYFKTYFPLGENKVELCGKPLTTESLDLSGDYDFTPKYDFKANDATYTRDLSTSESTWFSLCLPFAYTPDNFTAYQLMSATADAVEIEEITTEKIVAGTPVLFKFKDAENKVIYISEKDAQIVKAPVDGTAVNGTDGSSLQLCGTYQTKTFSKEDGNAFILLNDKLMNPSKMLENQKVTKVGVKPFRGYMTLTASEPQRARAFSIGHGDEEGTTAIDLLNSVATDDAEYYDINGRRIDAPAKGVNIVRRGNKTMKLIIK